MFNKVLIFAAVLVAVMLWWRSSLYDKPHIDIGENHGVRGAVLGALPPSGFRPGHVLRDTVKNDAQTSPPYMDFGRYAHRQFLASSAADRLRVLDSLRQRLIPVSDWIRTTSSRHLSFLCVGESHQDTYRHFLAEHFFTDYELDVLYLETRLLNARLMEVRADVGEQQVDLLNANIAEILRVAQATNPDVVFVGIEESGGQLRARRDEGGGSRDQSLFDNIVAGYNPGQRTAALLGALHCTRRQNWLFSRLERSRDQHAFDSLLSMRLMSERKDLLSREFARFLDLLGYPGIDYVITDSASMDAALHGWFLDLTRNFERYDAVILFRDGPGEGAG